MPVSIDGNDENVYDMARMTHGQVRGHIERLPAVVMPLGGCEPLGDAGELGAESACAGAVAAEISRRCGVLVAPVLPFGCSVPFISFAGAGGVRLNTFVNLMGEILHGYVFQGINRIFLISAAPFNAGPCDEVLRRATLKYAGLKMAFFDINTVLRDGKSGDFDRDDGLILSIMSYIRQKPVGVSGSTPLDREEYRAWKRRGRDPQKFRAICPDGLMLPAGGGEVTPAAGKELFDRVVAAIQERIGALL